MSKYVRGKFKFNIQQFTMKNPDHAASINAEMQERIKNAIESEFQYISC